MFASLRRLTIVGLLCLPCEGYAVLVAVLAHPAAMPATMPAIRFSVRDLAVNMSNLVDVMLASQAPSLESHICICSCDTSIGVEGRLGFRQRPRCASGHAVSL